MMCMLSLHPLVARSSCWHVGLFAGLWGELSFPHISKGCSVGSVDTISRSYPFNVIGSTRYLCECNKWASEGRSMRCTVGLGRCDMAFAAGFVSVCQALACDSGLTVVFEMESLSVRMITKRAGSKYCDCLCNKYIAF